LKVPPMRGLQFGYLFPLSGAYPLCKCVYFRANT
jgi:hypothetical protein